MLLGSRLRRGLRGCGDGGGGERQDGGRPLRLRLAGDGRLDPGGLATVAVGLHRGEGQVLGVRERATGRRELLERPGRNAPPSSARNSTTETELEISSPCASRGVPSSAVVIVAVQPATGWTRSEAIAASTGIWMRSETVLPVSLSLGTRKVIWPKPPGDASDDDTEMWADAAPPPTTTRPVASAATTARRARGRGRDTELEVGSGRRGGELVPADGHGEGPGAGSGMLMPSPT